MKAFKKNIYSTASDDSIICLDCVAHDVTIGTQIWTGCNSNVSTYRNGNIIPQVTDPTAWSNLTTGAWCYHVDDPSGVKYGKLYNWYAVNDPRGIAPAGYHIPTDFEFTTLVDYLGGSVSAGTPLKEVGECHWIAPNIGTDTSGFTALPGAGRYSNGNFSTLGYNGNWWTSTIDSNVNFAYILYLNYFNSGAARSVQRITDGYSLRFVKDACVDCVTHDVVVGSQTWAGCNATVETYEDGTVIPQVTDVGQWTSLTTGAWCYYDNDPTNGAKYGKLYNWYAVAGIHNAASLSNPALRKKLAPTGYHVPSNTEFNTLFTTAGGGFTSGFKLREPGTCHWVSTNDATLNPYGFSALGTGTRDWDNVFRNLKNFNYLWSAQGIGTANPFYYSISVNGQINTGTWYSYMGMSVRFIKD